MPRTMISRKNHTGQCDFARVIGTLHVPGRKPEVLQACSECDILPKYSMTFEELKDDLRKRRTTSWFEPSDSNEPEIIFSSEEVAMTM